MASGSERMHTLTNQAAEGSRLLVPLRHRANDFNYLHDSERQVAAMEVKYSKLCTGPESVIHLHAGTIIGEHSVKFSFYTMMREAIL